jgi:uncharacterized protein
MSARDAARRDLAALTFALFFPTAMTWFYFVAMHQEGGQDNPHVKAAFGVGKALQFGFPLAYVGCFELPSLLRRPPRPKWAGLGMGLCFGALVGTAMLIVFFAGLRHSPWLEKTPAQLLSRLQQFNLATPAGFLGVALFYSIVHSFLEEYYWRWFVFGRLERYLSLAGAMLVSSLGFMLHHVVVLYVYFPGQFWLLALPFALAVAVGGAFWAWLYHTTGTLYASWLSHALVDAAIMVIGYALLWPA